MVRATDDALISMDDARPHLDALRHLPGDLVCTLDGQDRITAMGANTRRIVGATAESLLGQALLDGVHPDDRAVARDALGHLHRSVDGDLRFRVRLAHEDGRWLWFDALGRNLLDDADVRAIVLSLRDVTAWVAEEERLREHELMYRTLAEGTASGICQFDAAGALHYVNERWTQITGYSLADAQGHGWERMLHPDDRNRVVGTITGEAAGLGHNLEFRIVRADGDLRWLTAHAVPVTVPSHPRGTVCALTDLTEQVLAQRDSERLTDIFEGTKDLIGIADLSGRVLYLNATAKAFLGVARHADLEARNLAEWFPVDDTGELGGQVLTALSRDGMWYGEITITRHDGVAVPMLAQMLSHTDEHGRLEYFSGILHDISNRKRFESQLAHQATHDPLTGLPNRSLLLDRLRTGLDRARRHGNHLAVLFLDLDHFKIVNDSLGHGAGDDLLMTLAARLRTVVRPGDTVARYGGDEFVVLCEDVDTAEDAIIVAERITDAISGSFTIDQAEIFVGASIGIAMSDEATPSASHLIRDADAAMYRAKERGRSRWELFDRAMRASTLDRLGIENALRLAAPRDELRLRYQPIISLATGRIESVEALLRWEHPQRGLLAPGEFIAIAEETGLIVPIGAWVLDQACRDLAHWREHHPAAAGMRINVNLSGRQLDEQLIPAVRGVLAQHAIEATDLELEVTESVLMDDVEHSGETLQTLKSLGARLVIDDFGTGYSSLSYLRRFPVDVLKVDRSFVDGLGNDPGDTAIVTAVVSMAHSLGLQAVAEGIETEVQLDEARRVGCDQAQGFLLARPGTADDIADLLESGVTH